MDLNLMRKSGRILAEALQNACSDFISPGMSALGVSQKMEEVIRSYEDALPAFKGYNGFPEAVCVSINDQVVHTIPTDSKIIQEGDIVSVDCGVNFMGHFTDACRTVFVGEPPERTFKLLKATEQALMDGIKYAVPGMQVGDISYAIQKRVERNGFRVHLEFAGHGIGEVLHGSPCIPNYGPPRRGSVLKEGMCLAIEPVVFDGSTDCYLADDKWTVVSVNGNLSAHFEDTIIITSRGPEIITR